MGRFKFTTGISAGEAQLRSTDLVEVIKSPTLVAGIESQMDLDSVMPAEIEDPYPVIILINGSGGCGKGTLIKQIRQYSTAPVYELSTVDPLRPVAKRLMEYQQDMFQDLYADEPKTAADEEDEKGGPYRQFLSDLKYAWSNHGDGPSRYVIGTVLRLITNRRWTVDEKTGLPIESKFGETHHDADGGMSFAMAEQYDMPTMIFINAREPKNIEELQHEFWSLGLLCITMKMEGIEHAKEDLADSDLMVDDFDYDVVVRNKGTIDDLGVLAFTMTTFIRRANRMYGVSVSSTTDDPEINTGRLLIYTLGTEIGLSDIDDSRLAGVPDPTGIMGEGFGTMPLMEQLDLVNTKEYETGSTVLHRTAAKVLASRSLLLKEYNGVHVVVEETSPWNYRALTLEELVELTRAIIQCVIEERINQTEYVAELKRANTQHSKEEPASMPLPFHADDAAAGGLRDQDNRMENRDCP